MKKITLVVLSLINLSHFLFAQEEAKRIDSLITQYVHNADFTGSVLVAKGGNILLKKGYGYANAEEKVTHTPNTVFNIASLTKTVTAALVLKLAEAGKLSLDDHLNKYDSSYPNGDQISIRQLLTHTSGIANYTDDNNFRTMDQTKEVSLQQMIAFFRDKPLDFGPGTKFRYSNSGYTMLGYIIEKVTAMSYAKALEGLIFKPLGMQQTSYGPPAEGKNLAKGYGMFYKNFTNAGPAVHPSISYTTGAIYSTVEDLYKWHRALQGDKFLSKGSLKAAYKKDRSAYGFGWFTDSLYGKGRVSHDGNISGFKANINRIPEDDVCVVALSNANNSSVGRMVRDIMNILYHQPVSKTFAEQPVIAMAESVKQAFVGVYKFRQEDSSKIVVAQKDTTLYITINDQPEFAIEPVFKNQFKSGATRVEFMMNREGKPEQIIIYSKGEIAGGRKVQ